MAEREMSNCLLITILILTTTMFIWTINTITTTNQIHPSFAISAFSA